MAPVKATLFHFSMNSRKTRLADTMATDPFLQVVTFHLSTCLGGSCYTGGKDVQRFGPDWSIFLNGCRERFHCLISFFLFQEVLGCRPIMPQQ